MYPTKLSPEQKLLFLGDAAWVFTIVNSFVFLAVMVAADNGVIDILSPGFAEDGFCVSNKDKSVLVQSHFLAFYADMVLALLLIVLTRMNEHIVDPFLVEANYKAIPSILIHGISHAEYGWNRRPEAEKFMTPMEIYDTPEQKIGWFVLVLGFWVTMFGMSRGVPAHRSKTLDGSVTRPPLGWPIIVAASISANCVLAMWIPTRLGMIYVQMVLYIWFGITSLRYQERNEYYTPLALAFAVNGCSGWLEATQCHTFYRAIGGHMWYDAMIPLSILGVLWYAVRVGLAKQQKKKKLA